MRPHTLASIVTLLRDSRLLRPREEQALGALARCRGGAGGLVRAVLRQDWLTPYQAVELFAGRGQGLLVGDYVVLDRLGQAGLGLQHAYEKALIHRDVKPANLLLTSPGAVVKVLDLGLALPIGRLAAPFGAVKLAGTPDYMAPEQALDPPSTDTRSDVYGL